MMILFSMLLKFSGNYLNNNNQLNSAGNINFLATAKITWSGFMNNIVDFSESYKFKAIIFDIKTVSFVISILLLAGIIFVIFKMMALGRVAQKKQFKEKKTIKIWNKIEKKLNSGIKENYKLAVLEADKFYDESLKIAGYEKEKGLVNIEDIKKAKRIKKNIIDDNAYVLTKEEAEKSVYAYKGGLEELGVL